MLCKRKPSDEHVEVLWKHERASGCAADTPVHTPIQLRVRPRHIPTHSFLYTQRLTSHRGASKLRRGAKTQQVIRSSKEKCCPHPWREPVGSELG
eukprot:4501838-Pleurochrysis_carterae.AAC.1